MHEIIKSLAATSKRKEKIEILESLAGDDEILFKKIVVAAYNPEIKYYIKNYDRPNSFSGDSSLSLAINSLSNLSSRKFTGNAAIEFLQNIESTLTEDDANILNLIIQGDLKCGIGIGTFNKVWAELVYDPPYMRCSQFNKKNLAKIKHPAYSQTKEDGLYVDIIVDDNNIEYRSRSGSFLDLGDVEKNSDLMKYKGFVLMGEAMVIDDEGNYLPRKEGNGYLNKDDIDTSKVKFVIWDMIPLASYKARKCTIGYLHRLNQVVKFISDCEHDNFRLVNTVTVNNSQEVIDHFKQNLLAGKEGTVIKNLDGIWADYDSPDQIKCKIEFQCDLLVTDVYEGTNKNQGKLGALGTKTSDSLLKVSVGGGFKDKERVDYFTDDMKGKIITVKANDIINNRTEEGVWSLFLPRFIEIRYDKTEADSYERVLEQRDAFIELLGVIK